MTIHLLNKSQGILLHLFCSVMTFTLCTKNRFGFICLGSSFIKQDEVYLPKRANSLICPSLFLPCSWTVMSLEESWQNVALGNTIMGHHLPSGWEADPSSSSGLHRNTSLSAMGSAGCLLQSCVQVQWWFKVFCVEQSLICSAEPLAYD